MSEPTKAAMSAADIIFADEIGDPKQAAEIIDRVTGLPELVAALKWYVENDDADETPDNRYWIDGRERAKDVLRKAGEL